MINKIGGMGRRVDAAPGGRVAEDHDTYERHAGGRVAGWAGRRGLRPLQCDLYSASSRLCTVIMTRIK